MRTYKITDNPNFLDRYTIYIGKHAWTMSHNPASPQGVFMYAGMYEPFEDEVSIELSDTSEDVRRAITGLLIDAGVEL